MPKKSETEKLTPREFYLKKLHEIKERLSRDEIVQRKEFDITVYYAENHRCLSCGNPKDLISPNECKRCMTERKSEEYVNWYVKSKDKVKTKIKFSDSDYELPF